MTASDTVELEVRRILNEIIDPCSRATGEPAGLADMGLVHEVEVSGSGPNTTVRVVIGITEFGCMMGGAFVHDAHARLAGVFGGANVRVQLSDRFDWLPEHMTAAYRQRLAGRQAEPARLAALRKSSFAHSALVEE
jgi:metal-sulfur cluster biosynthetic enzyme